MASSSNAPVDVEPDPLLVHCDGGGGVDAPPPESPAHLTVDPDTDQAGEPARESGHRHDDDETMNTDH